MWQLVILPSACQETHNRFIVPVNKSFRSSQTYYCLMQWEPPAPCTASSQPPEACKHRPCMAGAPRLHGFVGPQSIQARCTSRALYFHWAAWEVERDRNHEAEIVYVDSRAKRTCGFHAVGPHKLCWDFAQLKCRFVKDAQANYCFRITSNQQLRDRGDDFTLKLLKNTSASEMWAEVKETAPKAYWSVLILIDRI